MARPKGSKNKKNHKACRSKPNTCHKIKKYKNALLKHIQVKHIQVIERGTENDQNNENENASDTDMPLKNYTEKMMQKMKIKHYRNQTQMQRRRNK